MSENLRISLTVTPEMARLLNTLGDQGLFGTTATDVAERLLAEKLREVVREGWVGPTGTPGITMPLVKV
jgi:hypothetical protein